MPPPFDPKTHLYGLYDDLNAEQMNKVRELSARTAMMASAPSYQQWCREKPTLFMTKFLYARKWIVDEAAEMYRRASGWRLYHRLDTSPLFPAARTVRGYDEAALQEMQGLGPRDTNGELDVTFKAIGDISPMGWHKWDKQGRPVFISRSGVGDADELAARCHMLARPGEKFSKRYCDLDRHMNEVGSGLVLYNNTRLNCPACFVSQVLVIEDCRGLSLRHFFAESMELFKDTTDVAQAYYPEGMAKVLVTNAPGIISVGWAIIRPLLDIRLQNKVQFMKPGQETREELLKHIDAANLPKFLGGDCECPGGCVPCKADGNATDHWSTMDKTNLTHTVQIPAGATEEVSVGNVIGEKYRWAFSVDANDVNYRVAVRQGIAGEQKWLAASDKVAFGADSFDAAEFGCSVKDPCQVSLHFGNQYSRIKGKTVRYRVEPQAVYDAYVAAEARSIDPAFAGH